MKRFFTLVLVFCIGVTVGAVFFAGDGSGIQVADILNGEDLIETISGILGTTRETGAAVAEDLKPLLSQTGTMTDEELAETINALTAKYNIPALSTKQMQTLISLIRTVGSLGQGDLTGKAQEIQEAAETVSETVSRGTRIYRSLQSAVQSVSDFYARLRELLGR